MTESGIGALHRRPPRQDGGRYGGAGGRAVRGQGGRLSPATPNPNPNPNANPNPNLNPNHNP
eukprot:scaffold763_cov66-Phaeocystis_antarctica.AAC.1